MNNHAFIAIGAATFLIVLIVGLAVWNTHDRTNTAEADIQENRTVLCRLYDLLNVSLTSSPEPLPGETTTSFRHRLEVVGAFNRDAKALGC